MAEDSTSWLACLVPRRFGRRAAAERNTPIVCGADNNQLASVVNGERLRRRNIFYVPDYVAKAGGIINVAGEYFGWPETEVRNRSTLFRVASETFTTCLARRASG
jgi:glutamate dehydrogenase/leucine dehydrogenase